MEYHSGFVGGKVPAEVEAETIVNGAERKMKYSPSAFDSSTKEFVATHSPLQIYGETEVVNGYTNEKIPCKACNKTFSTKSSLKRHEERNPLCVKWCSSENIQLILRRENIIEFLDNIKKTILCAPDNELKCKHCSTVFSTSGNLHKHFKTAVMCNQYAMVCFLQEAKKLSS